jgi:cytoskeletal protein CcmA (bactofilin family)
MKKYKKLLNKTKNNMSNTRTTFFTVFICSILFTPFFADAMVIRWGESFTFEPYTTIDDDLYAVGDSLVLSGTTTGDVLVAGSNVRQAGRVIQDGFYVGGRVTIDGDIGGDLRGVGGDVTLTGHVKEDVILIGGAVQISKDAVIDGDVLILAEHFSFEGTTNGVMKVYARAVELKGVVEGSIEAHAKESVSVTGDAHLKGDLYYEAPREAFISDTVTIDGETFFTQKVPTQADSRGFFGVGVVFLIIISVISSLVLLYLFPAQTKTMTREVLSDDAALKGIIGFALVLSIPFFALALLISVIGILPALIIMSLYVGGVLLALALAPIVASVILVRLLKKPQHEFDTRWVALGATLFALLTLIPFLGTLVRFIVFVLTFYGVLVFVKETVWKKRFEEAPEDTPVIETSAE